jgi:hypothetical protein
MSEWIKWAGGKCPVPDGTLVDVEYRDGSIQRTLPANVEVAGAQDDASCAYWANDACDCDIVRYRLCVEPTADVDGWIEWNGGESSLPMGTLVEIRCRDGIRREGIVPVQAIDHWTHMLKNPGADIVQYRVHAAPQADGWIEWNGGECPVADDTAVAIMLRNGLSNNAPSCMFRWEHTRGGGDIVRYRVCTTQPPPADDGLAPIDPVTELTHPLSHIFAAALAQVTNGKGAERHANGAEFMDQPWLHLANVHGNGFLTGQAAKKLDESQGMTEHDRWEREMLGAIVYAAMAIIHRRMQS